MNDASPELRSLLRASTASPTTSTTLSHGSGLGVRRSLGLAQVPILVVRLGFPDSPKYSSTTSRT